MIGDCPFSAQVVNSLAMHTLAMFFLPVYPVGDLATGRTHQRRHHDREPGIDHVLGETGDLGGDARDLVDHDDPWARALAVRGPGDATVGERTLLPAVEHRTHANLRTAASADSARNSTAWAVFARSVV